MGELLWLGRCLLLPCCPVMRRLWESWVPHALLAGPVIELMKSWVPSSPVNACAMDFALVIASASSMSSHAARQTLIPLQLSGADAFGPLDAARSAAECCFAKTV